MNEQVSSFYEHEGIYEQPLPGAIVLDSPHDGLRDALSADMPGVSASTRAAWPVEPLAEAPRSSDPLLDSETSPKRVFIQTYGCQMNESDSDKMLALLKKQGYARTDSPDDAELLVLNTCSIREKAENKLYSTLGRYRNRKDLTIAVTGCVAQQEGDAILKKFPFVDLVMGPDAIPRVGELVSRAQQQRVVDVDVFEGLEYPFVNDLPEEVGERVSAFVTIQKGCDNKCTFCIVPTTRGVERSRPADDIVAEVRQLVSNGVREVTLLGQNVNSYGLKDPGGIPFAQLLTRIDREVEGLLRVRFTTSHPRDFGDDLIEAYASLPTLKPYLHLPVQSGSNRVLRRMKRYYKVEQFIERMTTLKARVPQLGLSTDFIVGFPGETDSDFEATLHLLEQMQFDFSYSFMYSPRPGTPALKLQDDVPAEVKRERLLLLQEKQRQISHRRMEALVGTVQEVLVEGASRNNPEELSGRTPCNKMVNFPGRPRLIGTPVQVRILRANPNSLRGEVVTL